MPCSPLPSCSTAACRPSWSGPGTTCRPRCGRPGCCATTPTRCGRPTRPSSRRARGRDDRELPGLLRGVRRGRPAPRRGRRPARAVGGAGRAGPRRRGRWLGGRLRRALRRGAGRRLGVHRRVRPGARRRRAARLPPPPARGARRGRPGRAGVRDPAGRRRGGGPARRARGPRGAGLAVADDGDRRRTGACAPGSASPPRRCSRWPGASTPSSRSGSTAPSPAGSPRPSRLAARASGKPVVVYPNSGEAWDAAGRRWTGAPDLAPADVRAWVGGGRTAGRRLLPGRAAAGRRGSLLRSVLVDGAQQPQDLLGRATPRAAGRPARGRRRPAPPG